MKVKPLRVLLIVTIFISVISIGCGVFIYNDMKEREEKALNVSNTRKSLIKDEDVLIKINLIIVVLLRLTKDTNFI